MNTFAVIGAGFSGTVAAIEFLNRVKTESRLIIINRSGLMARGLAYGTNSPQHLLNVPAGNMTALADSPDSFLAYCQKRRLNVTSSSFVSRKVYGEYLAELLEEAIKRSSSRVKTLQINAEVIRLKPCVDGASIELNTGEIIKADQIALTFGHFPPSDPSGFISVANTPCYQRDPWDLPTSREIDKTDSILLVGGGLTAVDVISNLIKSEHIGNIYMLSRRGLLPKSHREARSHTSDNFRTRDLLLEAQPSILKYLKVVRKEIRNGEINGIDWRDIIASLRPITAKLWKRLPDAEKRRFLRHVQSYWDVHRHRVAPETFKAFDKALEAGQIVPIAGRIESINTEDDSITAIIRERRRSNKRSITAKRVINCTGPTSDPRKVSSPLMERLIEEGLIVPDTLGLGVCVDDHYYLKSDTAQPNNWLSYVGPMLKADHWELTAVPELREAARRVAINVCEVFEGKTYLISPEAAPALIK